MLRADDERQVLVCSGLSPPVNATVRNLPTLPFVVEN
jgi:hypothetical protein